LTIVDVYSDTLQPGWSLKQSFQTDYDLKQTEYVDNGRYAIEASPKVAIGTLFFTVNKGSPAYRHSDARGVRFRLSGGSEAIANDALTVAVVGSNAQPYWVADDNSVKIEGRVTQELPLFPETRLYYLDINTAIPAGTWVDVVVWLDDLQYEPEYTYVTGFYLKTERDVLPVFYVDQVQLLLDPAAPTS
jgi:hypothetical protein